QSPTKLGGTRLASNAAIPARSASEGARYINHRLRFGPVLRVSAQGPWRCATEKKAPPVTAADPVRTGFRRALPGPVHCEPQKRPTMATQSWRQRTMRTKTGSPNGHAVVIGGSMAGLLAARVLARHFECVTVLERDHFPAAPAPRKGTPQARHAHVLLGRGQRI